MISHGAGRRHGKKEVDVQRRFFVIVIAFVVMLTGAVGSAAEPDTSCATPRAAVESLFDALQPGRLNPKRARACLDPRGRSPLELEETARVVKRVFDARGLYVKMERLSNDAAWVDPETGRASVAPHPSLDKVRVARQADGKWRWTADSLDEVASLYEAQRGPLDEVVEHLPAGFHNTVLGVKIWQYLALILLASAVLLLRKVLDYVVRRQVRHLSARFGQVWVTNLVGTIASPGATLAAAGLLRVAYPQLGLPIGAAVVVDFTIRMLVVLSLIWALYRLVDVFTAQLAEHAAKTESKLDDQLVPLVRKSLKILVVVAGVLFLLQNFDVNVGSLLAGLGLGGLAFALAAKDTLANFFGSIMIFVDRPFQVGDWVVVKGVEGIVEEVGFRSTRIRTFYNSQVSVPNAAFTETQIDNYGRRRYRRTYVTLNLTYDTTPEQMQAFVEGIRGIIVANSYSRKDYYEVHMSGFGAHSLDVMVYFFFEVPNWSVELRERHHVFLEILRLARDLGVTFAFPTQTLHLDHVAAPGAERALPPPLADEKLADVVRAFGPKGTRSSPKGPKIVPGGFVAKPELASYPE